MSDEPYTPLTKKDKLPLKYACFQPDVRDYIANIAMDEEVKNHINDLYELINYQMKQQIKQESQIIAIKHMEAWKRYDKPKEHYNQEERRYFTEEELKARKC